MILLAPPGDLGRVGSKLEKSVLAMMSRTVSFTDIECGAFCNGVLWLERILMVLTMARCPHLVLPGMQILLLLLLLRVLLPGPVLLLLPEELLLLAGLRRRVVVLHRAQRRRAYVVHNRRLTTHNKIVTYYY